MTPPLALVLHGCFFCGRHPDTHGAGGEDVCPAGGLGGAAEDDTEEGAAPVSTPWPEKNRPTPDDSACVLRAQYVYRRGGGADAAEEDERVETMTSGRCSAATRRILEGVHIETADVLSGCAMHSVTLLREQGWQGGGADYSIGVYTGDLEDCERLLGRRLSPNQVGMLERCIKAELDATE